MRCTRRMRFRSRWAEEVAQARAEVVDEQGKVGGGRRVPGGGKRQGRGEQKKHLGALVLVGGGDGAGVGAPLILRFVRGRQGPYQAVSDEPGEHGMQPQSSSRVGACYRDTSGKTRRLRPSGRPPVGSPSERQMNDRLLW